MASFICSTFYANHHSVNTGALHVDFHAISTQTALLAPAGSVEIAAVAAGTVGTLFKGALQAHFVAQFLIGTALTDLRAGTIGTLSAFHTQVNAGVTFVTFLTVGRSIDHVFTIRASVCCKDRHRGDREHTDHHNEYQQHTDDLICYSTFHFFFLLWRCLTNRLFSCSRFTSIAMHPTALKVS